MKIEKRPDPDGLADACGPVDLGLLMRRRPIPVLPNGSTDLFQALGDPSVPFEELTRTLNQFPSVVARLLAVANSPWSSPATPVLTLDGAISRLGLDVVRSASVALLVSRPFDTMRCDGFDATRYWCSALLMAEAASRIATTLPRDAAISPAIGRTAGLICNLGLLWLADAMPEETSRGLHRLAADPTMSTHEAMMLESGISYSHAGAALARTWDLPPLLSAALSYRLGAPVGSPEHASTALMQSASTMVSDLHAEMETGERQEPAGDDEPQAFPRFRDDLRRLLPEYRSLAVSLFRSPATER